MTSQNQPLASSPRLSWRVSLAAANGASGSYTCSSLDAARARALELLASYGPRSRCRIHLGSTHGTRPVMTLEALEGPADGQAWVRLPNAEGRYGSGGSAYLVSLAEGIRGQRIPTDGCEACGGSGMVRTSPDDADTCLGCDGIGEHAQEGWEEELRELLAALEEEGEEARRLSDDWEDQAYVEGRPFEG